MYVPNARLRSECSLLSSVVLLKILSKCKIFFSDGTAGLLRYLIAGILSLEPSLDNDVLTHNSDRPDSCIPCSRQFTKFRQGDRGDCIFSIAQGGIQEIINQSQEACWRLDIITTHSNTITIFTTSSTLPSQFIAMSQSH